MVSSQGLRIYIAGRMSNMPLHNYPAFNDAEKELRKLGYDPINPVHHSDGVGTNMPYRYYIEKSILDILYQAQAVAVLPDWEKSLGATAEVAVAIALGLPVQEYLYWIIQGQEKQIRKQKEIEFIKVK